MSRTKKLGWIVLACAITLLGTPPPAALADDAYDAANGAHGHGPGQDAAPPSPDTVSGIWTAIDAEVARLEVTVKSGELSKVHSVAFEIRDLVRALPAKFATLPDAKQKLLGGLVTRVDEHAANLDRYGDSNNAEATRAELDALKSRLGYIRKLYPESLSEAG